MKLATEMSPTESMLQKLELKFTVKEEFFTVKLPDDVDLKFKNILNVSQRKAMRQFVSSFAERVVNKNVHPDLKKYLPIDQDVAESLGVICYLSHEPKFTEADVMRLHSMPFICDLISYQIQAKMIDALVASDVQEIEQAKKDSAPINSAE